MSYGEQEKKIPLTGHVDRIDVSRIHSLERLVLSGWMLHPREVIRALYFGYSGSQLVPADANNRPDVEAMLPDVPHARKCGYTIMLPHRSSLQSTAQIFFEAHLESGEILRSSFFIQVPIQAASNISANHSQVYAPEEAIWSFQKAKEDELAEFLSAEGEIHFVKDREPLLSVVLVLWNKAPYTLACLRSLHTALSGVSSEVILVDNGSKDLTEKLLARISGVSVIENEENIHFVRGANQGAKNASGKYILFVNNDAVVSPDAIELALSAMESERRVGALGAKLIRLDGKLQEAGSMLASDGSASGIGRGSDPDSGAWEERADVDFCSGAFLLTPKAVFEDLQGFDEIFSPAYYEDADYCLRLKERGLRTIVEPRVRVLHVEHGSSEKVGDALTLMNTNRKIFLERHSEILWRNSTNDRNDSSTNTREILFIDDLIPLRERGQGSPRAHLLFSNLLSLGSKVTFLAMNESTAPDASITSLYPPNAEILSRVQAGNLVHFFQAHAKTYDAIVVSRPHNLEIIHLMRKAVPELNQTTKIIYDAEAVFAVRSILQKEIETGVVFSEEERNEIIGKEVELARGVDAILTVSERESEQFKNHGLRDVKVLSYGLSTVPTTQSLSRRSGILTVGPIFKEDLPNADALRWFLDEIQPIILKSSERNALGLTHAGVCTVQSFRDRASADFCLAGLTPNLVPLYGSRRIFVAPTRYSAGIPIKVIEAAAHGLPVVCTPLVAQQLGWEDGKELLVGYTAEDFASQCIRLSNDEDLWKQIRKNALERVQREYSPKKFTESLLAAIR